MSRTLVRYWAYDQCLQNRKIKYTWRDLLEKANEASEIADYEPIRKTQFYKDIKALQSRPYNAPIETYKEGVQSYYYYTDPNYSLRNQQINELEAQQLRSAIMVLSRFKGMPQFDWVNEVIPKIEQQFGLNNESVEFIGFDQNVDLKGMEYFGELFNAILYQKSIGVTYQSFHATQPNTQTISPYYLKQYNNRWFLFGQDEQYDGLSNIPLDRIVDGIKHTNTPYIPNTQYDFNEYFEDFIGVTKPPKVELQRIKLWFTPKQTPYIHTKPIHGTQKQTLHEDGSSTVTIQVIPNFELEQLLLSYGEGCRVEEPKWLREKIRDRVNAVCNIYDD